MRTTQKRESYISPTRHHQVTKESYDKEEISEEKAKQRMLLNDWKKNKATQEGWEEQNNFLVQEWTQNRKTAKQTTGKEADETTKDHLREAPNGNGSNISPWISFVFPCLVSKSDEG